MKKQGFSNKAWTTFKPGSPVGFDPYRNSDGFFLDIDEGQRAIDFFHEMLVHIEGPAGGLPVQLELWQQAIVGHLYGWKSQQTGLRRFREAFIFVPRKNGKSLTVSGLCLYSLFCQGEPGAGVHCLAADKEQARIVFRTAKAQMLKSKELSERGEPRLSEIRYPAQNSYLRVLSSETASKHGLNSSMVVFDELHAIKDRELIDVLQTSVGARLEPLIISITTAGYETESICREKYEYSKRVLAGDTEDASFMPVIYELRPGAEWHDFEAIRECNPNLGVSIQEDYMKNEIKRATESPGYQAAFQRLHCNVWTEASNPLVTLTDWDRGNKPLPDMTGRNCWIGLDMSATHDLTALAVLFKPEEDGGPYYVESHAWLPSETARKERRQPFQTWFRSGHLYEVPGATQDYRLILEKVFELSSKYNVVAVAYDRAYADPVRLALEDRGLTCVAIGQGMTGMTAPTKEFVRLVMSHKIIHGGHPVLRWCVSNTVGETDAADNLKPNKRRSAGRIDLVTALICALAGAMKIEPEAPQISIYEGLSREEIIKQMAF